MAHDTDKDRDRDPDRDRDTLGQSRVQLDLTTGDPQSEQREESVKSVAVVKYTNVVCPAQFVRLQCNTDLKEPPANWLSSATDSYGLRHALTHSTGFSSFRMAHKFPDCVGEVDVVSGAECIKSLLKLPYQPNAVISMIVHRVENTLLVDDFDILRYLMKSDWSWMKKFFYEIVVKSFHSKDQITYVKSKSRHALQEKNLISKFLYHSLAHSSNKHVNQLQLPPSPINEPKLPDPSDHENIPDSGFTDCSYNRNVMWTFEDIQMLIGSNMPIFGGADRPCVSLRLRDAGEPINVLTGIDYWLDNLMCNVPEVVMCYHLDGIVQKYEPIKTEDLPNLKDSKFSPNVIKSVAQNILSFLKSNATKAGHTYWLFKGVHDDVVKLYDLTTLCGNVGNSSDQNPFTVPVAMLLYRVARNMKSPCQSVHIKMLLENCLKLLPIEKYPQIVASSYYMLSDLYVPAGTNPGQPNFDQTSQGDCECGNPSTCRYTEVFDEDSSVESSSEEPKVVKIFHEPDKNDGMRKKKPRKKPSLPATQSQQIIDRCLSAIEHVKDGLSALKLFPEPEIQNQDCNSGSMKHDESPHMAKPFQPIPMKYEPLNVHKTVPLVVDSSKTIPTPPCESKVKSFDKCNKKRKKDKKKSSQENNILDNVNRALLRNKQISMLKEPDTMNDVAWKLHLKILLYEKACLSYATLSECYYSENKYGLSFKYIILAQLSQNLLYNMLNDVKVVEDACLLGRAGDNYFQFSIHWKDYQETYVKQINYFSEEEKFISQEIYKDMETFNLKRDIRIPYDTELCIKPPENLENAMLKSIFYYSEALKHALKDKKEELYRRIASVKNELGVKYMYDAQEKYNEFCNSSEEVGNENDQLYEELSQKSISYLKDALQIFEKVNDIPNLALLHCNTGRFLRFRAHCNLVDHSSEQKKLYSQAIDNYKKALQLSIISHNDKVRDLVQWELSSALYNQACLIQNYPPKVPRAAQEAVDALLLALKNCPLTDGPHQCLYQFRAASIHHRLASLYHNQCRELTTDNMKFKSNLNNSKTHYIRATELAASLEDITLLLTIYLEQIALIEYQANNVPGFKFKSYQEVLKLMQETELITNLILEVAKNKEKNKINKSEDITSDQVLERKAEEEQKCQLKYLSKLQEQVQYVLKVLIQMCLQKHSNINKKDCDKLLNEYKSYYSYTLKTVKSDDVELIAKQLHDLFQYMKEYAVSS